MPRTLYLHIGLPKTASTFLQNRVFSAMPDRRFVSVPGNGYFAEKKPEQLLKLIFSRSETIWKYGADEILEALLGPGWREDDRDILISDEAIGRTASRQGLLGAHLAALEKAVRMRGIARVKLLCMVRRQDHWLASHYVQMSDRNASAGQTDFEALIARVCDARAERFTFGALLDYASILSAAREALGEEAVAFFPMEWLEEGQEELTRGLARFLDVPAADLNLGLRQRDNVRRAGEGRWTLRRQSLAHVRLSGLLRRGDGHIELTPDLSRRIQDVYRASNVELEREASLDLQALGYFSAVETVRSAAA